MSQLSSKHLFFIIPGLTIVSIKTYPRLFTRYGGRDTWISLLIASIFIIIYVLYVLWICKKKKCFDFISIYEKSVGKIIGRIFLIFFTLNVFLTTVESCSVEASAMHNAFLNYIPVWKLILFSIPVAVYIVKLGYHAVLDSVLIGIFFISISGVILFLLTKTYKDYTLLLPILEHGFNKDFLISIIKLIGAYSGISILFLYLNDVEDIGTIRRYCLIGLLFVTEIHIVSMTGTLSTFEINIANSMSFPKLMQTQLIRQSNFLDAGELFVMLQIVGGWFVKIMITLFALTKMLERLKASKILHVYVLGILLYISTYIVSKNIFRLFDLLNIFIYLSLINFIVIPLIVFTIYLLRKTA